MLVNLPTTRASFAGFLHNWDHSAAEIDIIDIPTHGVRIELPPRSDVVRPQCNTKWYRFAASHNPLLVLAGFSVPFLDILLNRGAYPDVDNVGEGVIFPREPRPFVYISI